jgi:hypothetical protein
MVPSIPKSTCAANAIVLQIVQHLTARKSPAQPITQECCLLTTADRFYLLHSTVGVLGGALVTMGLDRTCIDRTYID